MEAHVEPADDGRWSKLASVLLMLVYFVADIVPAFVDELDFIAFFQFLGNHLKLFKLPYLEAFHQGSHELRVLVVLVCQVGVLDDFFQVVGVFEFALVGSYL